jgi:predicted ATPase
MDRASVTPKGLTHSFKDGVGTFMLLIESGSRPASLESALQEILFVHQGQVLLNATNGYTYLAFTRPSQALQATVRLMAKLKSHVVAAIVMCETDANVNNGEDIEHRLSAAISNAESGQLVITLATYELARLALDADYSFDELGNYPLGLDGGYEKLLLVQHPSLPKRERPVEGRKGLFRTSTFVGRDREVAALRRQMDLSRCVTIVGPPGIGKTALIHRLLPEIESDFVDGTQYIDLGPVARESMLLPTINRLMGVAKLPGEENLDALVAFFREKRALLVFDSCEHLVVPLRRVIDALLSQCPNLAILTGTQSSVKAIGEDRFMLGGLEVPSPVEDWRSIREYESVALFVDRAQLANHSFTFDESIAASIANLCRRLDGIPLAIELAATKTSILNPKQILDRLDHRFILLQDRHRDPSDRHQTLRATIDWSYGLLEPHDKALLRRLSVFAGAFSLEQAEQVCAFDEVLRKSQVFGAFEKLFDSSFLNASSVQTIDKRFFLSETMRLYAAAKLKEVKEDKDLIRRHREWCAEFAETANSALLGPDQLAWIERMDASYEDVRMVIEAGLMKGGDADLAVRTIISCHRFFFMRNYLSEGLRLVEKAISTKECEKHSQFPRIVNLAGALSSYLGDSKRARRYAIQSYALSKRARDLEGKGSALVSLAINAQESGELRRCRRYNLRATAAFRTLKNHQKLFVTLMNMIGVEADLGEFIAAHAHLDEALSLQDEVNDSSAMAYLHQNAAHLYLVEGIPSRTISFTLECLPTFERLRNHIAVATSWRTVAHAAELLGRYESAAIFLGAARKQGASIEARPRTYDVESLDDLSQRLIAQIGEQLFRSQLLIGSLMSIGQLTQELDKIRLM